LHEAIRLKSGDRGRQVQKTTKPDDMVRTPSGSTGFVEAVLPNHERVVRLLNGEILTLARRAAVSREGGHSEALAEQDALMATISQALDQMIAAGMPAPPHGMVVADARFHRYGPKKRCWYKLHEFHASNGRQFISGSFGYWGLIESMKIERDLAGVDPAEIARLNQSQADTEKRELEKRVRRARDAAARALQQWHSARAVLKPEQRCPYLDKKGVKAEKGLRYFSDGSLVVPMLRYDVTDEQDKDPAWQGPRRVVGLQKIAPDGSKRFNKGMWKEGAMCRLGKKPKDGELLVIAEGVATALSGREAIEQLHPVFIAFDCYNLVPAAKILRAQYPSSPILFVADDDFATDGNPGATMAAKAAAAVGQARVVKPSFGELERGEKDTDFNDLHARAGLDAVRAQLVAAIALLKMEKPPAAAAGGKGAQQEPDWDLHDGLLRRFTLVYPSDTAFDFEIGKLVKVEHMRLMFGKKPVQIWLGSARKRVVSPESVVFDPSETCDPETTVNLFRGIRMKPSAETSCDRLIELLAYLCNEDHAGARLGAEVGGAAPAARRRQDADGGRDVRRRGHRQEPLLGCLAGDLRRSRRRYQPDAAAEPVQHLALGEAAADRERGRDAARDAAPRRLPQESGHRARDLHQPQDGRRAARGEPRQHGLPLERAAAAADRAARSALHGDPHAGRRSTASSTRRSAPSSAPAAPRRCITTSSRSISRTSTSTRSRSRRPRSATWSRSACRPRSSSGRTCTTRSSACLTCRRSPPTSTAPTRSGACATARRCPSGSTVFCRASCR
jgi:phage/plasmid primase-like uncharacterized protein